MSNHSSRPDPEMSDQISKLLSDKLVSERDRDSMGPTGRFPRGRLTPTDEGEIGIRIAHVDGVIVINFGKPIAWIGFPASDARELAALLVKHADEIDSGG